VDYYTSTGGLLYLYWWIIIPLLVDYYTSTGGLLYLYWWIIIPLLVDNNPPEEVSTHS
jgi:hypothetical protein